LEIQEVSQKVEFDLPAIAFSVDLPIGFDGAG
jgi:hypothetical protein